VQSKQKPGGAVTDKGAPSSRVCRGRSLRVGPQGPPFPGLNQLPAQQGPFPQQGPAAGPQQAEGPLGPLDQTGPRGQAYAGAGAPLDHQKGSDPSLGQGVPGGVPGPHGAGVAGAGAGPGVPGLAGAGELGTVGMGAGSVPGVGLGGG